MKTYNINILYNLEKLDLNEIFISTIKEIIENQPNINDILEGSED